jgi:hypothetical protein
MYFTSWKKDLLTIQNTAWFTQFNMIFNRISRLPDIRFIFCLCHAVQFVRVNLGYLLPPTPRFPTKFGQCAAVDVYWLRHFTFRVFISKFIIT